MPIADIMRAWGELLDSVLKPNRGDQTNRSPCGWHRNYWAQPILFAARTKRYGETSKNIGRFGLTVSTTWRFVGGKRKFGAQEKRPPRIRVIPIGGLSFFRKMPTSGVDLKSLKSTSPFACELKYVTLQLRLIRTNMYS